MDNGGGGGGGGPFIPAFYFAFKVCLIFNN